MPNASSAQILRSLINRGLISHFLQDLNPFLIRPFKFSHGIFNQWLLRPLTQLSSSALLLLRLMRLPTHLHGSWVTLPLAVLLRPWLSLRLLQAPLLPLPASFLPLAAAICPLPVPVLVRPDLPGMIRLLMP